jgi:hypothetical protein
MPRRNWDKVAAKQFESLEKDIRDDWSDLRDLTLKSH